MAWQMSFTNAGNESSGIHYPIRKDILDKLHPMDLKMVAPYIKDLLRETSTHPLVWNPKTAHRKNLVKRSWILIKEGLGYGRWKGFNTCKTLIENAEEIFLDQRRQFYLEYIENYGYVAGTTIAEFKFLEKNAPTTMEELFKIDMDERFIYEKFSPLMKPEPEQNEVLEDADWSDIEADDLWVKLEKENIAREAKNRKAQAVIKEKSENDKRSDEAVEDTEKEAVYNPVSFETKEPEQQSETLEKTDWSDIEADDEWDKMEKENAAKEAENALEEGEIEDSEDEYFDSSNEFEADWSDIQQNDIDTLETVQVYGSNDADWSDIEAEDYWTKLEKQNAVKETAKSESEKFAENPYLGSYENTHENILKLNKESEKQKRRCYSLTHRETQKLSNEITPQKNLSREETNNVDVIEELIKKHIAYNKSRAAIVSEPVAPETARSAENPEIGESRREEPNHEDIFEDFFDTTILPVVEAVEKKLCLFGRIVAGTFKKILEQDEPKSKETEPSEKETPKQIEMDVLDSNGKKVGNPQRVKISDIKDVPQIPRHPFILPLYDDHLVEERVGLFGRIYYVNYVNKTVSLDNPHHWMIMPEQWETRVTDNCEIFYYNNLTGQSQWQRPQSKLTLDDYFKKYREQEEADSQ